MNPSGLSLDLGPGRPLTADSRAHIVNPEAMSRKRDPNRFTRKETVERLKEAKDYLANKERAAFVKGTVYLPPRYYSTLDESYFCSYRLDSGQQRGLHDNTLKLVTVTSLAGTNFFAGSVAQFVDSTFELGAPIGMTFDIAYYAWSNLEVRKLATLWLGTWHHAPLLVWAKAPKAGDQTQPVVKFNPLPKYMDLIH